MLRDKPVMRFVQVVQHWFSHNTRRQAQRNIHAHYDIGNAFYSARLDPNMTYSSALFEKSTSDLTAAQANKYRGLAEALDVKPGPSVARDRLRLGRLRRIRGEDVRRKRGRPDPISTEQRDFA